MNTASKPIMPVGRPAASWARVCYGIDDGSGCAVRAERSGRRVSWTEAPIRDATRAAEADGAAVAAGMPVGSAIATWVGAPFPSARKAQRVFPTLLDIQLPFPLEDCAYGFSETVKLAVGDVFFPLSDGTSGIVDREGAVAAQSRTAALACAARIADVEQRLLGLNDSGIDPHVLDYEGVALWTQGLHEHAARPAGDTLRAVVFLRGEDGLMAIGRGTHFWSAHRIRFGDPTAIDRYLRSQLSQIGVGADERPPVDWFWAGIGLADGQAGALLRSEVEVRWPGPSISLASPESFLARALATRALLPGPLRVNLRAGALSHTGATSRTNRAQMRTSALLFIVGAALCGGAAWWEASVAARQDDLNSAFQDRLNHIVGYPVQAKGSTALLIAEREHADRAARRAPLASAFSPSLLTALQDALPAMGKNDVRVGRFDLSPGALVIKGDAPSVAAIHALRDAVVAMGFRAAITIGDERDARTGFVLDAMREDQDE